MFGTARTVAVRYRADVSGYVAGMRQAQAATSDFSKRAQVSASKNKADWDKIGTAAMAGGLAIGAGVALAIKKAADFEQAMSAVGSVSNASASEMKALSEAAMEAGEGTIFSATEAAAAQAELAKAGVSTADILGGALKGSLDLAAAGGIDLASAAETAAQAMNLFNLEGKDVTRIADVLTNGANKSAAGVKDLSQALQQGGTVASATGLTLEETVGALAMFADYGIKGSDAGTSLKTMLQRLTPTSEEASKMMEHLGVNAYDASGEFIGLEKFAGNLQTSMAGLTDEQRAQAMTTIFGSDAVRAANILFKEGAEGAGEYERAMKDVGSAQRMAERMTDNLRGDIEALSGAFETALIKTGSGGTDALRGWVQGLEGIVQSYNDLPRSAQSAILTFSATSAGLLLVGGAAMKATTSIIAFRASLASAGLAGARTTKAMKALGKGLAIAGVAYAATELRAYIKSAHLADITSKEMTQGLIELGRGGETAAAGLNEMYHRGGSWYQIFGDGKEPITAAEALDRFALSADAAFAQDWQSKVDRFLDGSKMKTFENEVSVLDDALAEMVSNGHADKAALSFEQFMGAVDPAQADKVRALFKEYPVALDKIQIAADGVGPAIEGMNAELDTNKDGLVDAAEAAENYQKQLTGLSDKIAQMGGGLRAERAAIREYSKAHDEAKKAIKGSVEEQDTALENMAASALNVASAQIEMGRNTDDVAARMSTARQNFIDTAVAMGKSRSYAIELANAMGLVPADVVTQMSVLGVEGATAEVLGLRDNIELLSGKTVTVKEEGANPSSGRVMKMRGDIFGLTGKTVTVTEIGTTAAGERVVRFQGKIYKLTGKTVDVSANVTGAAALDALQNKINAMNSKTVTLTTRYVVAGKSTTGGIPINADGGMYATSGPGFVRTYAHGGFDGSFRGAQPQIRPAGGGGVQWAEEGAGPWEAFISGHPAKLERSRAIWLETGKKLGLIEAFANGGVYGNWQAELRNVRSMAAQYRRTIRFEDGSSKYEDPLQIFEDGTARWAGFYAAPAGVAAAIARLNAAQDRYEDAKRNPQKGRHSAEYYETKRRQQENARNRYQGKHSAEYYETKRRQQENARRRGQSSGGSGKVTGPRKLKMLGPEVGGGDGIGLPKLGSYRYPGRDASTRSVSSQNWIPGRTGGGGVDTAVIARAVAGAISRYQPVVQIDGRTFHGFMKDNAKKWGGR